MLPPSVLYHQWYQPMCVMMRSIKVTQRNPPVLVHPVRIQAILLGEDGLLYLAYSIFPGSVSQSLGLRSFPNTEELRMNCLRMVWNMVQAGESNRVT